MQCQRAIVICIILFSSSCDNTVKTYYPEGSLKELGEQINDKKEGQWITFYPNGDTMHVEDYQAGKLHGYKVTFVNRKKSSVAQFKNGLNHGLRIQYHPNGRVMSETEMKNGERSGLEKFYYETGELQQLSSVVNGTLTFTDYYRNGSEKMKYTDSLQIWYDSVGNIQTQIRMVDGKPDTVVVEASP